MKKILFIEDETALQESFKGILESESYQLVIALDGEVGLRLAITEKPDLILLDLVLPKIYGLDVLKQLKASPETKDIPVIILTNLDQTENIKNALELGATTYLVKSNYSLEDVVEKIKKALKEI
jgi:DNA-binding response OmpR family regulator